MYNIPRKEYYTSMFQIEFYELENGEKPALNSILRIEDVKLKAKVFRSLKLLETFGNDLGAPDTAPLSNGIFELRIKHSSNIVRCLYFYSKGKVIIVTNSFVKKTQKTPRSEIKLALERKADYEQKNR